MIEFPHNFITVSFDSNNNWFSAYPEFRIRMIKLFLLNYQFNPSARICSRQFSKFPKEFLFMFKTIVINRNSIRLNTKFIENKGPF